MTISVSALTQRISAAVEDLGPVEVSGELSQCRTSANGHLYATLKDDRALINLVMWASTLRRQPRAPREGDQVVVRGTIEVYPPRGSYQLVATRISPAGQGDLAARLVELKARLLAEGLFDPDRKRPLPFLPSAVGLATAPGSAALADMVDSIRQRFPTMPIVHAPCVVQGTQAEASIINALRRLDAHPTVEVIIVGRGGGSLEDLWAFNLESVVRAIVACHTPVVSAVGHETDLSLSDLAADVRAKTPTEAGSIVVPDRQALDQSLAQLHRRLDRGIDQLLTHARQRLRALATHRALAQPQHLLHRRRQQLDDLHQRLDDHLQQRLEQAHQRLHRSQRALPLLHPGQQLRLARERLHEQRRRLHQAAKRVREAQEQRLLALVGRLDALSPLAVIARGYGLIFDAQGHLIRHHDQVHPGQSLRCRVTDGWIDSQVTAHCGERLADARESYESRD